MSPAATVRKRPLVEQRRARERAEREAAYAKDYAEHVATYRVLVGPGDIAGPGAQRVESLRWAKPGTGFYRMDFLCDGPHLIVTGDIDDAVYEAGAECLAWWARCDLSYFHGKCIASHRGRRPKEWEEAQAVAEIRRWFAERWGETCSRRVYDYVVGGFVDRELTCAELRSKFREMEGWDALHSAESWAAWVNGSHWSVDGQNGPLIFGDDYWEYPGFSIGNEIAGNVRLHLAGLKAALTQLRMRGVELYQPEPRA